jgi:septum formation protein
MRIVLASASPRRKELLRRLVPEFDVVPSRAPECSDGPPEAAALETACAKARDVASRERGIVIGADTIVVADGAIMGKPSSRDDARGMLARLSGREHEVFTGLCVIDTESALERTAVERAVVHFRTLQSEEIDAYLDRGEYVDKAGAYGIQGRAGLFVDRICGDYYTIIGLPLCRLLLLLRETGVAV